MAKKSTGRVSPNGTDDFDIQPVLGFGGYVSSLDPTIADPRVLVRGSYNVYKKIRGTIANRCGRKLYDAVKDTTIAKIVSGYVWNTSLGATFPIRACNGKLEFYSTISGTGAWYTLLNGLTLLRFVFDTYWDNTDKKDKLLACNGNTTPTLYDWAGGVAKFVSAVANTSITMDRNTAVAGFASAGTVVINGHTYAYTGITGNTLTGVSGNASAEAVGSVAFSQILTVTSFTSGPTAPIDFIKVVSNQLYAGSYTSQTVYMSKNTSYTDFSFSATRLTGEGDIILLDSTPTGIGQASGVAAIFYGTSHLAQITFTQITVGTTLSEQTNIGKVFLGNNCAALAHEFINQLGGNILFLTQSNQLFTYGLFTNLFAAKPVMLSQDVADELAEENFTGGQLSVQSDRRGDVVYINAPASGKTYLYQERSTLNALGQVQTERLWQPPQTWNITRIDSIDGSVVGFSNSNPQIYYLWDTGQWHDDAPSSSVPYQSIALFSYQNIGRRQGKLSFDKIYWEGYLTTNSHLYGGVYYDYEGSKGVISPIINDPTSLLTDGSGGTPIQLFSGVQPPSLGDASLGDNPLGDGLNIEPDDQAMLPKFRCITGVQLINCFEYALMAYSSNLDARWELLAFGTNMTLATVGHAIEIIK